MVTELEQKTNSEKRGGGGLSEPSVLDHPLQSLSGTGIIVCNSLLICESQLCILNASVISRHLQHTEQNVV